MRIEFHPLAEEEFTEEAAYYENQVHDLGQSFISETETALKVLSNHPEIGVETTSPFRQLPLHRFPHSIIYTLESDFIWVIAVAHQRRMPGYWKDRLDE